MKNWNKAIATTLLIAGIANIAGAVPVDDNRRPLYVVKLSKYHWNDPAIGQSPYNGAVSPNGNQYWGHWVKFNLQVRDNNNQPYGLGNPIEQFHNYSENSNFSYYVDAWGQRIGPRYAEDHIGSEWLLAYEESTFTDNNRAIHPSQPRTDDGQYLSVPSTSWFEFGQRWHVKRRSDNKQWRTDSLHHLEATQSDRARTNG